MTPKRSLSFLAILFSTNFTSLQAQQAGAQKAVLPEVYINTAVSQTPVTGNSITVSAGGDLQAAINSAKPGDEIVLQAGATFLGNFTLPTKSGTGWITIRSSNMSQLPPEGIRVSPNNSANMAKIVAQDVSTAFLINPQANHYRLMGLEITAQSKQYLNYGLVMEGNPYDTDVNDLPNNIIFDRDYVHGQVLCHCKFGIQMNGPYFSVIDSYISEFHGLGQDTQGLFTYMSPGPGKVVNNYIEASGENVLWGGAYDAIPGIHPYDVEFRSNHVAKQLSWMNSIVPPPQNFTAVPDTGGVLAAGTYYYAVIALGTVGTLNTLPGQAQSSRSPEVSVAITQSQGAVELNWQEETYGDATDTRLADNYAILRTTNPPSAATRNWVYYSYTPVMGARSMRYIDRGASAQRWTGDWPRTWDVKNLFELKNAIRFLVDSNLFENNWASAQDGHAILFTPRTETDSTYPAMIQNTNQDITFTNNIVRHAAAGINMLSADYLAAPALYPQLIPSARIYIAGNLLDDINGTTYLGLGSWLDFGGQPNNVQGLSSLIVDHNTALQTGNIGATEFSNLVPSYGPFVFTNNITANNSYGLHINGASSDLGSMQSLFSSLVWTNNVIPLTPGTAEGSYTNAPGDFFPASEAGVGFANYNGGNGGDYELSASSPYKGAATDGTDPGANINVINEWLAPVMAGQPSAPSVPLLNVTVLSFAQQNIGVNSNPQNVVVSNPGISAFTITSGVVGTNAADFSESSTCANIASLANCAIAVSFKPTAAGTRTAFLRICEVTQASNCATVELTGSGAGNQVNSHPAAAPSVGTYDDSDSRITYTGAWTSSIAAGRYDETQTFCSTAGNTASFTFTGTQVTYVYELQQNMGLAQVSIDGNVVSPSVDEFAAAGQQRQNLTYSGLSNGVHTITVKALGTKDTMSTNSYVIVDAFVVGIAPAGMYDDTDPQIIYKGSWASGTTGESYDGTQTFSNTPGANATFTFSGTQVTYVYESQQNMGHVQVSIDGNVVSQSLDEFAAAGQQQQRVTYAGLSDGVHTIAVTVLGIKDPQATDCSTVVDAFIVGVTPPGVYDDSDPGIVYAGSWASGTAPGRYEETQTFSNEAGDKASFTFTGTQVTYVYESQQNMGHVQVSIDGTVVSQDVDEFAATGQQQQKLTYSGLANGVHTITVTVLGTRDTQSTSSYAIVDAFVVGIAPAGMYDDSNPEIVYAGSWTAGAAADRYDGTQTFSDTAGDKASFTFTGTQVTYVYDVQQNMGHVQVSIDGNVVSQNLDEFIPAGQQQQMQTYSGLSSGVHTITVTVLGTKDPGATDSYAIVDAFVVEP